MTKTKRIRNRKSPPTARLAEPEIRCPPRANLAPIAHPVRPRNCELGIDARSVGQRYDDCSRLSFPKDLDPLWRLAHLECIELKVGQLALANLDWSGLDHARGIAARVCHGALNRRQKSGLKPHAT